MATGNLIPAYVIVQYWKSSGIWQLIGWREIDMSTCTLIIDHSYFLLRTLVVGRRQHSESIEVALEWSKEV